MVSVYQRCLANYQSLQWDLGAYAMYNSSIRQAMGIPTPPCYELNAFSTPSGSSCLGDCLLYTTASGSGVQPCLNYMLQQLNVPAIEYFEYSNASGATGSASIDACQVFSGPAKSPNGTAFQACLNEYSDTGLCQMPLIVWSGRSANKVPVGAHHAMRITSAAAKEAAARRVYREVRDSVKSLLGKLNGTWSADTNNLQVSFLHHSAHLSAICEPSLARCAGHG